MDLGLFRPSGGLVYHWRAARAKNRWRPFCESLEAWLMQWQAPTEELILFGPSGGYTLPSKWLSRFSKISAFDTDPLAGYFFRRRHPDLNVQFFRENLFWQKGQLTAQPLREVLEKHPNATLLFSNLLGQLPLEGPINDEMWRSFLSELASVLKTRTFASYHDLYSLNGLKLEHHDNVHRALNRGEAIESLVFLKDSQVQVTDHQMQPMLWPKPYNRALLAWPLDRQSLHIIEGVHSAPSSNELEAGL